MLYLKEEVKMSNVFQNIPGGINVGYVDEETEEYISVVINDTICKMIGFSRKEIEERFNNKFGNLVCDDDRKKYKETILELKEYPHEMTIQYKLKRKNGEVIHVTDKLQSIRHEEGRMWIYACLIEGQLNGEYEKKHTTKVDIQTFGRFNVMIDGKPIAFRSEKAKELMALLIDRKGNYVSNREIITCLWEDELVDRVTQTRCRKVVFKLRKTLESYGIEHLLESKIKGYRRINTQFVNCDLYQYLSGDKKYEKLFRGNYMEEYSWAESTLSGLLFHSEHIKQENDDGTIGKE